MANPEHLDILKQGVEAWNQWRNDNPEVKPDLWRTGINFSGVTLTYANLSSTNLTYTNLSGASLNGANLNAANLSSANLKSANLSEANLQGADLTYANLHGTNLSGANLVRANLSGAKLFGTNLFGTNLFGAHFFKANLFKANLFGAKLSGAYLGVADLTDANLTVANLQGAKLTDAILHGANLNGANLNGADLTNANLNGANLSGADLVRSKLSGANFREADLSKAQLFLARLIGTNLDGATLTGAYLWETQRAEWSIKGVICEYVYWDEEGKEKCHYNPGEFERLFADKAKIRLFYKEGISSFEIATIPALIKHLEDSHPGSGLRLVSIREDSGGVVVELAIEDSDAQSPEQLKQFKAELEAEAQQKAQYLRQALDEALQLKGQIQTYERVIGQLLSNQKPTYYLEKGDIQMGDTYNVSGQAGAVGQNAHAHDMTFNQIVNHFEKSVDLPALAKQLGDLREEMAKRQDSSPQVVIAQGEAEKAEMAAHAGDTSKVVEYLKAGGQVLLDVAKETGKELLTAAIKASIGMQ